MLDGQRTESGASVSDRAFEAKMRKILAPVRRDEREARRLAARRAAGTDFRVRLFFNGTWHDVLRDRSGKPFKTPKTAIDWAWWSAKESPGIVHKVLVNDKQVAEIKVEKKR